MPSLPPYTPLASPVSGRLDNLTRSLENSRLEARAAPEQDQQEVSLPVGLDQLPCEVQNSIFRALQRPQDRITVRSLDKQRLAAIDRIFPEIEQYAAQRAADAMLAGESMSSQDLALIEKLLTYTVNNEKLIDGDVTLLSSVIDQAPSLKNLEIELSYSTLNGLYPANRCAFLHSLGESLELHPTLSSIALRGYFFDSYEILLILPYLHRAPSINRIILGPLKALSLQSELTRLSAMDYLGQSPAPKTWKVFDFHCIAYRTIHSTPQLDFHHSLNLDEAYHLLNEPVLLGKVEHLSLNCHNKYATHLEPYSINTNIESIHICKEYSREVDVYELSGTGPITQISNIINASPKLKRLAFNPELFMPSPSIFEALQRSCPMLQQVWFRIKNPQPELLEHISHLCNHSPKLRAFRAAVFQSQADLDSTGRYAAEDVLSLVTKISQLRSISLTLWNIRLTDPHLIRDVSEFENKNLEMLQISTRRTSTFDEWQPRSKFFNLIASLQNLTKLSVAYPLLDDCPDQTIWPRLTFFSSIRSPEISQLSQFLTHHPKISELFLRGRQYIATINETNHQEKNLTQLGNITVLGLNSFGKEEILQFFSQVELPELKHLVLDIDVDMLQYNFQGYVSDYLDLCLEKSLGKALQLNHITVRLNEISERAFCDIYRSAKAKALKLFPERTLRLDADKTIGPYGADSIDGNKFPWSSY